MEGVLMLLLAALAVGALSALFVPRARPGAWGLVAVLLYVPSCLVWFVLQYLQVIPVDRLAQALGIDAHRLVGPPLGTLVQFGPPLLPSIALLSWVLLRRRAERRPQPAPGPRDPGDQPG